jgi:archaeal cell division control protein 6
MQQGDMMGLNVDEHLSNYFSEFVKKTPLFVSRKVLQFDYIPEKVEHREEHIKQLAQILAPSLRSDKPSNVFLYGKTGSGKTLCAKIVASKIQEVAKAQNVPISIVYINCKLKKVADTEYRLIAEIISQLGENVPYTGLPTGEIYRVFFDIVDREKKILILILDEIDHLVEKSGDEILYSLTRINPELKNSQISFIGISNDLVFADIIDPRIKSSLSEEEILFPPYNAMQLKDILSSRSQEAFNGDVVSEGVVAKCAAYAAREHGDARRAIELLRVAGELAEREGSKGVSMEHIDLAEKKIERDRIVDAVESYPKQFQTVLYAIILLYEERKDYIHTGEVYDFYKTLSVKMNVRPLTQRRISDIIGEFNLLGIIDAKTVSKGRYGRMREILLTLPETTKRRITILLKEKMSL